MQLCCCQFLGNCDPNNCPATSHGWVHNEWRWPRGSFAEKLCPLTLQPAVQISQINLCCYLSHRDELFERGPAFHSFNRTKLGSSLNGLVCVMRSLELRHIHELAPNVGHTDDHFDPASTILLFKTRISICGHPALIIHKVLAGEDTLAVWNELIPCRRWRIAAPRPLTPVKGFF